jgi:hypothetical protein
MPLLLDNLDLRYDPYPIGVIAPAFDPQFYDELLRTFPPISLFEFQPRFGSKYSFNVGNRAKPFKEFIAANSAWRKVDDFLKSDEFLNATFAKLLSRGVDLGYRPGKHSTGKRLSKLFRGVASGRLPAIEAPVRVRWEFSALPAHGGNVIPHTDSPMQYVTYVISMVDRDEWNPEWGGGTDILKTKDPARGYNLMNKAMPYDETITLDTVPYRNNQGMLFVKTYDSLHGVKTMEGPEGVLRKTVTVIIERY